MNNTTRSDFICRVVSLQEEIAKNPEIEVLINDMHEALERGYAVGFDLQKEKYGDTINFIGKHLIAEMYNDQYRREDLNKELEEKKNKFKKD